MSWRSTLHGFGNRGVGVVSGHGRHIGHNRWDVAIKAVKRDRVRPLPKRARSAADHIRRRRRPSAHVGQYRGVAVSCVDKHFNASQRQLEISGQH